MTEYPKFLQLNHQLQLEKILVNMMVAATFVEQKDCDGVQVTGLEICEN
jgi:hypothetical protein